MRTRKHLHEPEPVVLLCYSVPGAARALGIGRSLAYKLIRHGLLLKVRISGRTVITVKECEAFLARGGA